MDVRSESLEWKRENTGLRCLRFSTPNNFLRESDDRVCTSIEHWRYPITYPENWNGSQTNLPPNLRLGLLTNWYSSHAAMGGSLRWRFDLWVSFIPDLLCLNFLTHQVYTYYGTPVTAGNLKLVFWVGLDSELVTSYIDITQHLHVLATESWRSCHYHTYYECIFPVTISTRSKYSKG